MTTTTPKFTTPRSGALAAVVIVALCALLTGSFVGQYWRSPASVTQTMRA